MKEVKRFKKNHLLLAGSNMKKESSESRKIDLVLI